MESGKDTLVRRPNLSAQTLKAFKLRVAPEILRVQRRKPKEIEDGACELNVTFARNLLSLGRRKLIAESRFEIAQGYPAVSRIEGKGRSADQFAKPNAHFSRQERNQAAGPCDQEPFHSIPDSLPRRTHGPIVTALVALGERGRWSHAFYGDIAPSLP